MAELAERFYGEAPVSDDEDIKARLRALEQARIEQGIRQAEQGGDIKIALELVRAVAPLVNEMATVRGVANAALDKAKEVESDLANRESVTRTNRWQLATTGIALAALLITFGGLVFVILQFAGAGAGP